MLDQNRSFLSLSQEPAERWTIVPCNGKRSLIKWRDLTEPSPARVREWAERFQGCNWAVKVGPPSGGLIVVDVDATKGSKAWAFAAFDGLRIERRAPFTATVWHETPRGYHFLFRLPERDIRDLPGKVVLYRDGARIEALIHGHLALIPPSEIDGFQYIWRLPPGPPAYPTWDLNRKRRPLRCWPARVPKWLWEVIEAALHEDTRPFVETPRLERPRTVLDLLATDERLVRFVHDLAGRPYPGVGKAFRCFLPGHDERHPSAAWWRSEDGKLWFHDFHRASGREWLGLAEVWHAIRTGKVRKLALHEVPAELTDLAARAGVLVATIEGVCDAWEANLGGARPTNHNILEHVGYASSPPLTVARAFLKSFREAARQGELIVTASKRYLADITGLTPWEANRAANALALLGMIWKLPIPRWGDERFATRWVLCVPNPQEFNRRWNLIKDVPLRELNRRRAAEIFGEELAAAVFRR